MRFSEALAITPDDFDFLHQTLSISKTWDYKSNKGFLPTKNKSSVRKVQIDWMIVSQFASLIHDLPRDKPIFLLKERILLQEYFRTRKQINQGQEQNNTRKPLLSHLQSR